MPQTLILQAGDLRAKVGFYKRAEAADGYGNVENGYSTTAEFTCAANIRPRLGGEAVLAARLTGTNFVNVTVRQSSRTVLVATDWKLKDERSGVSYNIRSIIDPFEGEAQHGRFLEILCEKGVAIGDDATETPSGTDGQFDFSDADQGGLLVLLEDI